MKISSLNGHVKPPEGAVLVRADVRQGWFVITYDLGRDRTQFYYNQEGREVFRIEVKKPTWWEKFKEIYANPDTPAIL